jgi:hypothetical protein
MSNVSMSKQMTNYSIHAIVSANDVPMYIVDGYIRSNKNTTIHTATTYPTLCANTVRIHAMCMFTQMMRTHDYIDMDMLESVPRFIFN